MACFINKCIAPSFMVFKGLVQHFGGTYDKSVIYETTYNCSGSQELNWFTTAIVVKGKRCTKVQTPLGPRRFASFKPGVFCNFESHLFECNGFVFQVSVGR